MCLHYRVVLNVWKSFMFFKSPVAKGLVVAVVTLTGGSNPCLKRLSDAKFTFNEMCVGSVLVVGGWKPPHNDKNPPSAFFQNLDKSKPLSLIKPTSDCWKNDEVLHRPLPRLLIDSGISLWFYHSSALSELSSVRHCLDAGTAWLLNAWHKINQTTVLIK